MRILTAGWSGVAAVLCVSGSVALGAAPPAEQAFVKQAVLDGMTEVEMANIASAKSSSEEVKTFAARMLQDHSKANAELAALAQSKSIKVPTKLDIKHKAMVNALQVRSGASFDAAYAQHMAADHAKAVALFTKESQSPDADMAAFAKQTLPTLQEHKRLADALDAKFSPKASS
jgi:putative membrane protein